MTSSNNISEIKPFSITVHFFEWNLNEMPGVLKQKIDSSIKMIKTWPGSSKKYQQIKLLIWQRVLWWWHRLSMFPLFYILDTSNLFKRYWEKYSEGISNYFIINLNTLFVQKILIYWICTDICVVPSQWNSSCKAIY